MLAVWPRGRFGLFLGNAGATFFGLTASLALGACSGVIDRDPYLGTMDPSLFDPLVRFATVSTDATKACLIPRRAFKAATGGGLDSTSSTWVYLGGLSQTQLDISNSTDPAKSLPSAAYRLDGCNAPEGRGDDHQFDARLDNYLKAVQYPVLSTGLVPAQAGTAVEPTSLKTYKPWHVVVPSKLLSSVRDRMGCNDVKSERSLLERAGWDRTSKMFPDGGPQNIDIQFPTRSQIQTGMASFKDWPMVSVAVPVGNTVDQGPSCPFVLNGGAIFPMYPGDPQATFQFPTQLWMRGLLGGYLDGGDLPVTTDKTKCPVILLTGKACPMMTECDATAGEVCSSGNCVAPVPICPLTNDLYVSKDEAPMGSSLNLADPLPNAKITLKDPMDKTKTRAADLLTIFAATPGQPGYSPVCRVHYFDASKVNCGRFESDAIAPRPLCTAAEIVATPGAVLTTTPNVYVHCLFPNPPVPTKS